MDSFVLLVGGFLCWDVWRTGTLYCGRELIVVRTTVLAFSYLSVLYVVVAGVTDCAVERIDRVASRYVVYL